MNRLHPFTTLLLGITLLSLACTMPLMGAVTPTPTTPTATFTPAPPTATPRADLPPALIEVQPPIGSEIALKGAVTLYFNQPMQRASVEAAISGSAGAAGRLLWLNDSTLTFELDQPLTPGSELLLNLSDKAQAANGKALLQPVTLNFRAADLLQVAEKLPAPDSLEVDAAAPVVVTFNQPVVPLGGDSSTLPAGFTLEPGASGRGAWINTSTYAFYPQPALAGGTTYTVQVNPNLQSAAGSPLEQAVAWQFTTVAPRVVRVLPITENPIALDATFEMNFNLPMQREATQAAFSLAGPNGAVTGAFGWNAENTRMVFTPTQRLAYNAEYLWTVETSARDSGGAPLAEPFVAYIYTMKTFSVLSTNPISGQTVNYQRSLIFYLSNPPASDKEIDLADFIRVQPPVESLRVSWSDYNKNLYVSGDFTPSQRYAVTLLASFPNRWGDTLQRDYTLEFFTGAVPPALEVPYNPRVLFSTPGQSSLQFYGVNLTQARVEIAPITLDEFFALLAPGAYNALDDFDSPNSQTFDTNPSLPLNQRALVDLPLSTARGGLASGVYFVRVSSNNLEYQPSPFLLVVSSVNLAFKRGNADALVWATRVSDAAPLQNATVNLYTPRGALQGGGQTDAQGLWYAPIADTDAEEYYSARYAVIGQPGDPDFALATTDWQNGLSGWGFGAWTDYSQPRLKTYLYTDRPIYRPGQTVYFKVIPRQLFDGRYSMPPFASLPVLVWDANGQEIARLDLPLSGFGAAHGEFTLPDDAPTGEYQLGLAEDYGYDSVYFKVAQYRKPEIQVQGDFGATASIQPPQIEAEISTRYFFDAPAGNITVTWNLYLSPADFDLPGYRIGPDASADYWMAYEDGFFNDAGYGRYLSGETVRTNDNGKYAFTYPLDEPITAPSRLTLEMIATDESQLSLAASQEMLLHPADFYIGARTTHWSVSSGQPIDVELLTVDLQKQPSGGREIQATLEKMTWSISPRLQMYDFPQYTLEYSLIDRATVTTDGRGLAALQLTPNEGGVYRIRLTSGAAITDLLVWVSSPNSAQFPEPPNQRLTLTADRSQYAPGDTAQIFIPNPFGKPLTALLTIERGSILQYSLLQIPAGGTTHSQPLSDAEAPNVYLSVTLLNGTAFRYGLVQLPVTPRQPILNVELLTQPERLQPGETVTLRLRVTNADGAPVQGEFSISVIDLAILSLADPNSQPIPQAFYSPQPLGIRTGLTAAGYVGRDIFDPGGRGGGGGDGFYDIIVRENFKDTAYWNPVVVTDSGGEAEVTFQVPDNLTTWQIQARGITQNQQVGEAQSEAVVTKPLLVRPVTPRFLVVGDHLKLSAIVHNNTQNPLSVRVGLQQSNGVRLDTPENATQNVQIAAEGRVQVDWWVRVEDAPQADLVFAAIADSAEGAAALQDAARPQWGALPIVRYTAPQTFATTGVLETPGERLELVSLPPNVDPQGGALTVQLAPSLAAALLETLTTFEHQENECTELTISRLWANFETYQTLNAFGLLNAAQTTELTQQIENGLRDLLAAQREDGGWGWWRGSTTADAYLTAYALLSLSRVSSSSTFRVPAESIDRAAQYLLAALPAPGMSARPWQLDRLALQNFALSQAGYSANLNDYLYQQRSQMSPWAVALLALTYPPDDAMGRGLLDEVQTLAIRSGSSANWQTIAESSRNLAGPIVSTSMVVYALSQRDPGAAVLPDAVRYLMAHRSARGGWGASYPTAWSILGLASYLRGSGELQGDFTFSAAVNDSPLAAGNARESMLSPVWATLPLSGLNPTGPNALQIRHDDGAGRLYYLARLDVLRPAAEAQPLQQGFTVSRRYCRVLPLSSDAQDCLTLENPQMGGLVQVRVTLAVPHDAYFVTLRDFIPAGSEILDFNLKSTRRDVPNPQTWQRGGWGWWYFQPAQILDDGILWQAEMLRAGTYELTYYLSLTHTGEFQVLPARAYETYFPEVQGTSAGMLFTVAP
ncbi:MAG: Ig-like domain-containing protein [Anaerolineales bacterium]